MIEIDDPLDSDDFNCIAFINQKFPTEASLIDLDTFLVGIGSQISALDEEISKAVQSQSVAGVQASNDVSNAQLSIQELFSKINDIKTKAAQSEKMVQEICADIKRLDCAKTHLQTSITSLKRLQMLMTAVGQLEILAQDYQYRDAANLLDAIKQLLLHFDKYNSVPLIADVNSRVHAIQIDLKKHVHYAFREIGQLVDTVADINTVINDLPGSMKSLLDACLVVDALGPQARKDLLEEFIQLQLVPYERLFGPNEKHFALDQVERRWSWFKRLMKTVETKFANICPSHWRLSLRLCLEFIERTKVHLVLLLTAMESKDQSDVHSLLKALQTTLRFEQEISSKFNVPNNCGVGNVMSSSSSAVSSNTVSSISSSGRLATHKEANLEALKGQDVLLYVPTDHSITSKGDDEEAQIAVLSQSIAGGISGVFDRFLGSYVLLERQNLEELLQRLGQEDDTTKGGDDASDRSGSSSTGNVYGSSMHMFVFIKNSIKRCTALTTGQTFLSLTKEFKTCIQQYTQMLRSRCLPPTGQPLTYRLGPGAEVLLCYLVNTGEYCAEVVPQLEQMIKQKIAPHLTDKVDLSNEVEVFTDLVAYSLKVLVTGIIDKLEPALRTMQTMNLAAATHVGEESQYIHLFNTILTDVMPKIHESLTASYYNNFCTKLATEILGKYLDVIMKHKRISEMGTQQLLLDTYSLKTLLLHLHNLGLSQDSTKVAASSLYLKLVSSRAGHIEIILKLLGTPEELLLERFKIMWPDGQSSDLASLMEKKGMNRSQQQMALDAFKGVDSNAPSRSSNASNSSNLISKSLTSQSLGPIPSSVTTSLRNVASDISTSVSGNLTWK